MDATNRAIRLDDLFRSSTPIKTQPNQQQSYRSYGADQAEVKQLQASMSQMALENEELKFELEQLRHQYHELDAQNQQLHQTVQNQREIETKMRKQLNTVTRTVYIIYERFKSLKSRYYEEQFGVAGSGDGGGE